MEEPIGVPPKVAKKRIGCGNTKLYELLNSGELESYMIGRARRITTASIRDYVDRQISALEAA